MCLNDENEIPEYKRNNFKKFVCICVCVRERKKRDKPCFHLSFLIKEREQGR